MSFNRRRACFVCGRIGHLADACSAPSRLCFQCGQPGHESSACEAPRTNDHKQCYYCGDTGHIKADCPTAPKGGSRPPGAVAPIAGPGAGPGAAGAVGGRPGGPNGQGCFNCGGPHLAKQCPAPRGAPAAAAAAAAAAASYAGGRGGSGIVCRACGGPNHFARDCRSAGPRSGGGAGGAGGPTPRPPKKCFKCQSTAHLARDCPETASAGPTAGITTTATGVQGDPAAAATAGTVTEAAGAAA